MEGQSISPYHAEIGQKGNSYRLINQESTYGTYLNGNRLSQRQSRWLEDGDMIQIGDFVLAFHDSSYSERTQYFFEQESQSSIRPPQELNLRDRPKTRIGRDSTNDIVIDHPSVSRFHADIRLKDDRYYLRDFQSTNGTFVNDQRVLRPRPLKSGDVIHIGPSRLVFNPDETLIENNEADNLSLNAYRLTKIVEDNVKLLDDISISIQTGEFVVIAGVSGSGKSTLLEALNGSHPATKGKVEINGSNLYTYFDAYRTQIGYVPQKDIIHPSLTVEQSLDYAARLRMPADITPSERRDRIREVLTELGLSERRQVLVQNLSGGQLKRISMGVELLTKPSLFFLDEATSGLDPGTEGEIMKLLQNLAHKGRIVTLITHATENIVLCDLVIFLAQGGRVAYFGPPDEALSYFRVEKFNQIYPLIEYKRSPEALQKRYQNSDHYQKYVRDRQPEQSTFPTTDQHTTSPKPSAQSSRVSPWRQWKILLRRDFDLLKQDQASLWLTITIAPLLGILDLLIWKRDLFDSTDGNAGKVLTMLFVATIVSIMVGSLSSMREIVKERDIYRRERMVCLQLLPYVLSKFSIGAVVALTQAAVFVLFKVMAVAFPEGGGVILGIYISLALATIGGMTLGLLVSAVSPNQNVAPLLTILVLIPQITLGGGLIPLNELSPPGRLLSYATLSRWTFESMVTVTGIGRDIAADECLAETKVTKNSDRCPCSGSQLFDQCHVPGLQAKYHPAVAEPAPFEPKTPGRVPSNRQALNQYEAQVERYQKEVEQWRKNYSQWKGDRERAIGEGEGIVRQLYENHGEAFDVNLAQHWTILMIVIATLISVIFLIQKQQDSRSG